MQFYETGTLNDEDDLVGLDEACGTLQDDNFKNNPEDEEDNNDETPSASAIATGSTLFHDISGSLEGMSVTFFAGYAAFKIVKEFKCDLCLVEMQRPPDADQGDINDCYINCREYNTKESWQLILLRRPTDKFRDIATSNLQTFVSKFKLRMSEEKLREKLMKEAISSVSKVYPNWYDENHSCYQHRLYATHMLYTAKLHRHCTLENRAAKEAKLAKRRATAEKKSQKKATQKDAGQKRSLVEDEGPKDPKNCRFSLKLRIIEHR